MKSRWYLGVFLLLTLAPATGLVILVLQSPEDGARRQERNERAALRLSVERARDLVANTLSRRLAAAQGRLRDAVSAFALGEVPVPASRTFLVDAQGREAVPRDLQQRQDGQLATQLRLFRELTDHADRLEASGRHGGELARETLSAYLDRFRDPRLRGEVLLRIARYHRQRGEELTARSVYRHLFERYRGVLTVTDRSPIDLLAGAALVRTSTGAEREAVLTQAHERLVEEAGGISLEGLERAGQWFESGSFERHSGAWRRTIAARRGLLAGVVGHLPLPFEGQPLAVAGSAMAAGTAPALCVFRPLRGDFFVGTRFHLDVPSLPVSHPEHFLEWRPLEAAPDISLQVPVSLPIQIATGGPDGGSPESTVSFGVVVVRTGTLAAIRADTEVSLARRRRAIGFLALLLFGGAVGLVLTLRREAEVVRFRSDLVEHVAHELRTPATTLSVFSNLLDDPELRREKRDHYLRLLSAEAQRIGFVVENVLDLSLPARNLRFEREEVDLRKLLEDMARAFEPRCREDGVTLTLNVADAPTLLTFRRGVARIIFNLLDNAVKYRGSAKGSGASPSGCTQARVELAAVGGDGWLEVSVSDNGPGVPRSARRKILRRRLPSMEESGGSGVGLAISARLARLLGGELRYEPCSPESGSQFTLRLLAATVPGSDSK